VKIANKETAKKDDSRVNADLEKLRAKLHVVEASMKNDKAIAKYYLIAGSFKSRENAEKLQDRIHNLGFPAEIIATKDNLYRVTLGGMNYVNDILKQKEKFNAAAKDIDLWLLKNF
jgi:cell division protein FtsN